MVVVAVLLYLGGTLLIGALTSRFVKNSEDFVLAGRQLPLVLAASALFATWFGAETVLGASSEFAEHGLIGVVEDPFGAALCLFLVGLLFARPLYRMNLLTFGDFYRKKFGRRVELVASLLLIPSYFGWIAAQLVATGILFHTLSGIPVLWGVLIGAASVLIYTYLGGMWAISVTDFLQTCVIIVGLLLLAFNLLDRAGGFAPILAEVPDGFFRFLPEHTWDGWITYLAAWMTIGLGSIPGQDIFQRVMAARSARTAVRASYLGSALYLSVAALPLFIALCVKVLHPELLAGDAQLALPSIVLAEAPPWLQVAFFGALLSAILSTTSGAILAPATILAENILRPYLQPDERVFLRLLRLSVVLITLVSTVLASIRADIYELVGESSAFTLVALFVPLVAGIYGRRTTPTGAMGAMVGGFTVWVSMTYGPVPEGPLPSILWGLLASVVGLWLGNRVHKRPHKMVVGSDTSLEEVGPRRTRR
ncbi:transporter, SSS family [Catalinimonas alkaloidigena]|uniref:Transporter, SSS family n=1 Tax=Catalinimonas alkaloidigena TaxID=1075417 RepID=A0A1G9IIQ6_9BACT|nr:sodium:solute symporter family protein [Catalinimonas alkaloidigena]SDL25131.1 transporter, SSS family [Catalinimonas alkaloidigena]